MSGNHFSKSKGHNSIKIICTKEDPDFNVVMIYLLHLSIEYVHLYSSRDNLQKLTLYMSRPLYGGDIKFGFCQDNYGIEGRLGG